MHIGTVCNGLLLLTYTAHHVLFLSRRQKRAARKRYQKTGVCRGSLLMPATQAVCHCKQMMTSQGSKPSV